MKMTSAGGVCVGVLWVVVFGHQLSLAQVPGMINYQGRVTVAGTNYTGTGSFDFRLVDGTGALGYWTANAVQLPVSNGMFNVLLGDTTLSGMVAIPYSVFTNSDVRLRVWFNGQQLAPDQRIAAVGYAMMAANVAGGYVDLSSPQTISGAKLLTTNLFMQQGTDASVRWGAGVGSFTDPESVVHPGVLFISANGEPQLLMTPDGNLAASNIWTRGEIDSDGDIYTRSRVVSESDMIVNSNIYVQGSITVMKSIHCFGDLSGSNLWTTGDIQANGDIHGANNYCSKVDCSGDVMVGKGLNVVEGLNVGGYSTLKGGFDAKAGSVVHGNFDVVGGTKNFVQSHPTDPAKEIVYTCLEGPEAGTYVRGSAEMVNGKAVIALPDHFGMVTSAKGLTVQLTPQGTWLELYVITATVAQVTVGEVQGRSGHFDYLVQGVRLGYENQPVIRERRNTGEKR